MGKAIFYVFTLLVSTALSAQQTQHSKSMGLTDAAILKFEEDKDDHLFFASYLSLDSSEVSIVVNNLSYQDFVFLADVNSANFNLLLDDQSVDTVLDFREGPSRMVTKINGQRIYFPENMNLNYYGLISSKRCFLVIKLKVNSELLPVLLRLKYIRIPITKLGNVSRGGQGAGFNINIPFVAH